MKYEGRLTSTNTYAQVNLPFSADTLVVMNNTPHTLFIRRGTASLPDRLSFDYLVPAGMYTTLAVVGAEFALALDIASTDTPSFSHPALFIFMQNEHVPSFSTSSFRQSAEVYMNDAVNTHLIDVRGARAIALEFLYDDISTYVPAEAFNSGELYIESLNDPGGSDARKIKTLNTPFMTNITRTIIPVTTSYLRVTWKPYYTNTTTSNVLRYTLLDTIPTYTPSYVTEQVYQTATVSRSTPYFFFDTPVRGILKKLFFAFAYIPFDAKFHFQISIYPSSTYTWRTDLTYIINNQDEIDQSSLYPRYLLNVKQSESLPGLVRYSFRFPLNIYISEQLYIRVTYTQPTTASSLSVTLAPTVDLEI